MADAKITELTELAEAPAGGDLLPLVDVSESPDVTKKITITNIIAAIKSYFDGIGGSILPGTINMYAGSSAPTGWVLCNGASLLRADYASLFSIIGTAFGSADGTHFNTPDLRGRIPMGVGTGAGGGASGSGLPTGGAALTARALADWLGEQVHTMTEAEMVAHVHTLPIQNSSPNTGSADLIRSNVAATGTINSGSKGSTTPFNVIQPVMVVNFIIKT